VSVDPSHFDALYDQSADPWGFRHRWYEQRKRAVTLAALPRLRYASGFETGCSIGELTAELAGRCGELLACDVSREAVRIARERVAAMEHVDIRRLPLPEAWPSRRFDLIVISEFGYYLSPPILQQLFQRAFQSLLPDGDILLCHWRYPVAEYPLTGDAVHDIFHGHADSHGLRRAVCHDEADFLLEVWSSSSLSVARAEGLT
jgi:SAM-dependent methyltransferase